MSSCCLAGLRGVGESRGEFSLARQGFNSLRISLPPLPHQLPAPPSSSPSSPLQHICRELCLKTASGRELIDGDMQAGAVYVCVCVCVCVCLCVCVPMHLCQEKGNKRYFSSPL